MLNDERTLEYIDGIATHWYWDSSMSPEIRNMAKTDKKDVFLLASEACKYDNFKSTSIISKRL